MKYKLSDICSIKVGFPFKSEFFNETGDGIRLVRGMNVSKDGFRWGGQTRWWNRWNDELKEFLLNEYDVLIAMDGNVGSNCALVRKADLPLLLVQRVARLRSEVVPQRLLWFIVNTRDFKEYLNSVKTGTTISHISAKQIGDYEVELPCDDKRLKIAKVLSNIDDKIYVNNQINGCLDTQAEAFYGSLVLRLEEGNATIGRLSSLLDFKYGKDHKKVPDGDIPIYGSGGIMRYGSERLFTGESVLVPRKGSLNNVIYVNEAFWTVDTMFYSIPKVPNAAKFSYHFIRNIDLSSFNAGSAVPSMTTDILNSLELRMPSPLDLSEFEGTVAPIYESISMNKAENRRLAELRDSLLPKLMSGEIDVDSVNVD